MILNEKERSVIEDLQTQEKSCVEKYARYAGQAKDPELQNLFGRLQKEEQEHYDSEEKRNDAFLATDCIGTEKLVSGTYNADVFAFSDSGVRRLLADIQVEEQNHAEMLYKYKTVNGMS